jgi:hypothetical protein
MKVTTIPVSAVPACPGQKTDLALQVGIMLGNTLSRALVLTRAFG